MNYQIERGEGSAGIIVLALINLAVAYGFYYIVLKTVNSWVLGLFEILKQ